MFSKQLSTILCMQLVFSLHARASLMAQKVKNLPAVQETWVQSLGQEDALNKELETHSSMLAWRLPWTEEPGGLQFSSVQSLSRVQFFVTPWTAAHQASLSITNSQSLLKLMSIVSVMSSNHLVLCHFLLPHLQSFPASISIFSNESVLHIRWPKCQSFSFSISPPMNIPMISFRMDWFDLLAAQGTLKSLLQHHSSKASILCTQLSLQSNSHIHTYQKNRSFDQTDLYWPSKVSAF